MAEAVPAKIAHDFPNANPTLDGFQLLLYLASQQPRPLLATPSAEPSAPLGSMEHSLLVFSPPPWPLLLSLLCWLFFSWAVNVGGIPQCLTCNLIFAYEF